MKYIKSFESTIKERVNELNDIRYNIEGLLMDLIDSGIDVRVNNQGAYNLSIKIDSRGSRKRFENIVDYLLSITDYMKTLDYNSRELKVILGQGYKVISCKIVDDKIKKYPLKDDRFIAEYLIGCVEIFFNRPIKRF